ncbi:MAG: SRPBCC family protein [Nocardioidaceae bacterium]
MTKRPARSVLLGSAAVGVSYYLTVSGQLTLDTGRGRRMRALGPFEVQIAAPVDVVFDVVAGPYLGRTPHAMAAKLRVLERGLDMVLAEHYTPIHGGRMTATTLETVKFERPRRIGFRLVRGPVPYVTERFDLTEHDGSTTLAYSGEMGTDFGALGAWWGDQVAAPWEAAVRTSFAQIRAEAQRRVTPWA